MSKEFSFNDDEPMEDIFEDDTVDSKVKDKNKQTVNYDDEPDDDFSEEDDIEGSEYDIDSSAIVLFEDDDFYITDKGAVPKSKIKQDNSKQKQEPGADDKILGKFNSVEDLIKSYTELEKKLGANSEAVNKLREVEPVLPMLEALINDEDFLDLAERYFNDPEMQREKLMKSLGIEDGYQFDLNEALTNPKSKDAKILAKLQSGQQKPQRQNQNQGVLSDTDKKAFMEKYQMDESQFNDFVEKSKSRKLNLDDVYFILNQEEIIKKAKEEAAREALKQVRGQRLGAQSVGKSRSSNGSSPKKSPEDLFMDALAGANLSLFQ